MATTKKMLPYRPDDHERRIIDALAKKMGLPLTRVIGLAVRELAERQKIEVDTTEPQGATA